MLERMGIRNFALIEDMHIDIDAGITVITGETGAGKSILIDALSILLGERASVDFIRHGKESFLLEAVFDISEQNELLRFLEEKNIFLEEDMLFISRSCNRQGKSQILVNGQSVPLKLLRDIASYLVDIHGQYSNQALLDSKTHVAYLDGFLPEGRALYQQYHDAYLAYIEAKRTLKNLEVASEARLQEMELLRFQINDIEEAQIVLGEDLSLQEEITRFDHVHHLQKVASATYDAMCEGREPLLDILGAMQVNIKEAVRYDNELEEISELISTSYYQLEEAAHALNNYKDAISFDEERYEYCQTRDSILYGLKKKYGNGLEEVLAFEEKAQLRLEELEAQDMSKVDLEERVQSLYKNAKVLQLKLNDYRRLTNERIVKLLQDNLASLGMEKASLSFLIDGEEELTPFGAEHIELLFTPNLGEGEQSLAKIASGGELARIALAFKAVFQEYQHRTLVFDEIDVGISGNIAIRVAEKIKLLSKKTQVLVITHMPQTVAISTNHLHLEKKEVEGRTISIVTRLSDEEHIAHIARMIAGTDGSESAVNTAKELIGQLEGWE